MSVALVLGVAAGCPTFTLPPGTEVACSTNAECPTGFACRLDRCRPLDGETEAPGLDPQTELGPALVGVGGEVVVELVATEPLSAVVELVAVTASGRSPFVVSDLDEQRATGRWRVPDGEASGTAQVLATLADRAGNVASDVLVGTVALDTELPAVRGVVVGVDDQRVTDGDVVEVQLTASEPLRAGTTLAVAGAEVTPTTANDGDDAIAFRFTVGPEVAAGPVVGTVSLVDRAGNASDVEVELTVVDRTAPTVSERGRTAVGADGAILSVTVVSSEALGAAPTATLVHTDGAVVAADVIDRGDGVYLVTCTVDAAAGVVDGTWRFVIDTIVDVAGNDGAAFVAEGFTVDASAPAFVDTPQVSPFVISRQAGFDATTVRFVVGEAATATVRLNDGTPVDCDSADGRTYACIVVAEDIAASGAAVVFVAVTDVAGNTGFSSAGLVLDDVAPVVLSSNVALRGPPDALVDEVSALGSGARLDVALTIDDRAATVAVTAEPTAFPIARTSAADATPLTFAADVVDDTSEGPVVIGVELTDAVGNRAVVLLDTVEVDRTPPSPPPVDVADAVVYRRVPWGASSTGGSPRFAMALEQLAAGDVVIAWPRANKDANDELARAVVDDDGHADVSLGGTDRGEVFVSVVDGAGNESGVVRVRDVVWTASLGGKVAGSTLENPHGFLQVGNTHNRLEVSSASVLDGGRTGVADGQVAQTQVGVRFTRAGIVTAVDDGQLQQPAASFDAARGRIVAFSAEDSVPETWEHDGQQWQQIVPADPERDGNPPTRFQGAAMAWHGARQVSVLVGGSQSNGLRDTWTWDGRSWAVDVCVPRTFVDSAGPSECGPPSLSRPALAYDELAAEVVLFGGSNGGNNPTIYASTTWVWDGSWTRVCTGSCTPPPGREGASLAFDRARGVTVLFGGCDGGEPVAPRDGVVAFCAHEAACKADIDTTICGIREESELRTFEQVGGATCTALAGAFAALSACQTSAPCGQENAACVAEATALNAAFNAPDVNDCFDGNPGGSTRDCSRFLDDIWEWDGAQWTQRFPADDEGDGNPQARALGAMAFDPVLGEVVLVGGLVDVEAGAVVDAWSWDGVRFARRNRDLDDGGDEDDDGEPTPLSGAVAVTTDTGLVVVGGAENRDCNPQRGVCAGPMRFTGQSFTNGSSTATPAARQHAAMAFDSVRERVVMFGGGNSPQEPVGLEVADDAVWEWNGLRWNARTPAVRPSPRELASMVFDDARGVAVLFGGAARTTCDGATGTGRVLCPAVVWEYDGEQWTKKTPTTGPEPRFGHRLVYDSARQRTVLFGGRAVGPGCDGELDTNNAPNCGVTWEWDGDVWHRMVPEDDEGDGNPTGRRGPLFAYDAARGEAVLVSGVDNFTGPASQQPADMALTWTWNGTRWRRGTRFAGVVEGGVAVFDPARGRVVAFGGRAPGGTPVDTVVEWDGTSWSAPRPVFDPEGDGGPSGRNFPGAAFDARRGVIVVFGGDTTDPATWLLDTGGQQSAAQQFSFSFASAGESAATATIVGVEVDVDSDAESVLLWQDRWQSIARAPVVSALPVITAGDGASWRKSPGATLHLALRSPVLGDAVERTLNTDALAVTVRYRLPARPVSP